MTLWNEIELSEALGQKIDFKIKANRVSTDTRKIEKGDIFCCLKGDNFDGNKFAAEAVKKGAVAVISDDTNNGKNKKTIIVEDALKALVKIAKYRRKNSNAKVIAITGSVGKTTSKEVTAKLLATKFKIHATIGNLNNHIGVPLTLANMPSDTQVAVVEMGMNHENEIPYLSQIAKPNVTCITWVAENHIENLGSLENIAKAKAEIFDWQKKSGIAILPADNEFFTLLEDIAEDAGILNISSFGSEINFYNSESETAIIANERVNIPFTLTDNFHFSNILAALTISEAVGLTDLQNALEQIADMPATKGRGNVFTAKQGFQVIDESYNASPTSMKNALAKFSDIKIKGKKITILGDMLELGDSALQYHKTLSESLDNTDECLTFGALMQSLNSEIAGNKNLKSKHFDKLQELENHVVQNYSKADMLLIKGSHGSNLWKLVENLQAK